MITKIEFQAAILLYFGAMEIAGTDCGVNNPITATSGNITPSALRGENCDRVWIFNGLPNNTMMLVLKIVKAPLLKDVIKLNGENFIDDGAFSNCKILERRTRSLEESFTTLERIHKEFPNCKLRSGVQPGVTLSYKPPRNGFSVGSSNFAIEFNAVPAFPGTTMNPTTVEKTTQSQDTTQHVTSPSKIKTTGLHSGTTMSKTSNQTQSQDRSTSPSATKTTGVEKVLSTSEMAIIFGLLGGTILILLLILSLVLILRKRRMKHDVTKNDLQMNNFYQVIPETSSSGETNGQVYNEIPARTSNNETDRKTDIRRNTEHRVSAKDVVNPLYESRQTEKHSYEYIEVGFRSNGR